MKMNSWDKNRQELIYKQKLQSVKSTMHKSKNNLILVLSCPNAATLAAKRRSPQRSSPYLNQNAYNIKAIKDPNLNNQNNLKVEYTRQESHQKQVELKKILRDFGLQQYLRVNFSLKLF